MSEFLAEPGSEEPKLNQPPASIESGAPMTRRQLRELERAALYSLNESAALTPETFVPPVVGPAAVVPAATAPTVVAPASVMPAAEVFVPAAELPASVMPAAELPEPVMPAAELPANTFFSEITAPIESPSLRPRGSKKPTVVRPVKPPRGTTRPRGSAQASRRPAAPVAKRKPFKHQLLAKMMTFGAMVGAGLMIVATSVPANAFYSGDTQTVALAAPKEANAQVISVEPTADLKLTRDGYTATSLREQLFLRYGNRSFLYTNNPNGTIQWPFPIAVPISDTFGYRLDDCNGACADFHKGVDFLPGAGTTIQAIADGVVSSVINSHFGLGNHVIIDHRINGQLVQSVYAHMQDDSIKVVVGQVVKVTDPIGLVGDTGLSTGPHLHLEIHIGGVPVDPFEWLKANAN